jgi:hypothetical protein
MLAAIDSHAIPGAAAPAIGARLITGVLSTRRNRQTCRHDE